MKDKTITQDEVTLKLNHTASHVLLDHIEKEVAVIATINNSYTQDCIKYLWSPLIDQLRRELKL